MALHRPHILVASLNVLTHESIVATLHEDMQFEQS